VTMPFHPDQVLAFALVRDLREPPPRSLVPVRTHEEILAAARTAREKAARTRIALRSSRERTRAVRDQTAKTHERPQAMLRGVADAEP
jgi:hypothetical protein